MSDLQIVERFGMWWGYSGELPPLEDFKTHGRPRTSTLVGPFPSRAIAESVLSSRLAKAEEFRQREKLKPRK